MTLRMNDGVTQSVANSRGSGFLRRLTNTGRVAAAHTEGVGFALGQVEKGKARGLHWHPGVYPLPGVHANHTLQTNKQTIHPARV